MPTLRLQALEFLPLKIKFSVVGGSEHVVISDYALLLEDLEDQLHTGSSGDFVVALPNGRKATISSRDAKRLICLLKGYDESIVQKPVSSFIGNLARGLSRGLGSYLGVGMGKAIHTGSTKVGLEGIKAANTGLKPAKLAMKVNKNIKNTEKQFEIEQENRGRMMNVNRAGMRR